MNKHIQNREVTLRSVGRLSGGAKRKSAGLVIAPGDYVAVAPPINLKIQPVGNCMIWLRGLNADGYGHGRFVDGETLAHRQAFRQSRGKPPAASVLHLCHRPYCIQPSHLYDGDAQDNNDDRRLRGSAGLDWPLFAGKAEIVQRVGRYRWDVTNTEHQPPLVVEAVDHECEFIAPAMEALVCQVCGRSDALEGSDVSGEPNFQPEADDRNAATIVKHSRSFRTVDGFSIGSDWRTTHSVPLNRAERRRRDRAAKKSPFRDKPVLLGSGSFRLSDGAKAEMAMEIPEGAITGPGILMIVGRTVAGGSSPGVAGG